MDREFSGDIRTIEAPAGVSVASPFGLIDNSRWFWRMVVVDDEGLTSAKSPVGSFIYNRFNDPPTEFYLQEPAMKVSIESPEITFRWSASTDLDIRDRITYTLITARDPAFSLDVKQYPNISGLEHKPPASAFTVSGVYFWKVMVDDGKGGVTWGSGSDGQPWSFTLKLPAPEPVGQ